MSVGARISFPMNSQAHPTPVAGFAPHPDGDLHMRDDGGAERMKSDTESTMNEPSLTSDFSKCLSPIQRMGDYRLFYTLPNPPANSVFFEGVGFITLPLSESQALQIVEQCCLPGEESDAPPNNTLISEFDAMHVSLDDCMWSSTIPRLVDQAKRDLGITTASVRADLEKVILARGGYTYSGQDLSAKDSQGKFGSIAIFLPSIHQGGDVVCEYRGNQPVFATNEPSQSYATFLSDFTSRRLESGHLLILVLALSFEDEHPVNHFYPVLKHDAKMDVLEREMQPVRDTLRQWIESGSSPRHQQAIYFPLDYPYNEIGFSEVILMHQDQARLQFLIRLATEFSLEIFLVRIEQRENVSFKDRPIARNRASIFNLDGRPLTEYYYINSNEADRCLRESKRKQVPKTFPAAFAIVPRDSIIPFFFGRDEHGRLHSRNEPSTLIRGYALSCMEMHGSRRPILAFTQICEYLANYRVEQQDALAQLASAGSTMTDFLLATFRCGLSVYFNKLIGTHCGHLDLKFFNQIREWLEEDNAKHMSSRFKSIEAGLSKAIFIYPRPQDHCLALGEILGITSPRMVLLRAVVPEMLDWARQFIIQSLEKHWSSQLDRKDAKVLGRFCLLFEKPFELVYRIADKMDPGSHPAAFLTFINKIGHCGRQKYLYEEAAVEFYRSAAKVFIASTAFVQMCGWDCNHDTETFIGDDDSVEMMTIADVDDFFDDLRPAYVGFWNQSRNHVYGVGRTNPRGRFHPEPKPDPGTEGRVIHMRCLSTFVSQTILLSTKDDNLFEQFVTRLADLAPQIPSAQFVGLWLPLLEQFCTVMSATITDRPRDRRVPLYKKFASVIINAYINTVVGPCPKRPGLVRSGVDCSCPDCKGLNAFLANGSLKLGRFKADLRRCNHLQDQVSRGLMDIRCKIRHDDIEPRKTLLVAKTTTQTVQARIAWKERRYRAAQRIAGFGQDRLAALLGPDWMTTLSMSHLGGVGLNDLEMRTLLMWKAQRETHSRLAQYGDDHVGGLPFLHLMGTRWW